MIRNAVHIRIKVFLERCVVCGCHVVAFELPGIVVIVGRPQTGVRRTAHDTRGARQSKVPGYAPPPDEDLFRNDLLGGDDQHAGAERLLEIGEGLSFNSNDPAGRGLLHV